MKYSIIIAISLVLMISCSEKVLRKPPPVPCIDCEESLPYEDDCDDECCRDPCPHCIDSIDIDRKECTPACEQEVSQRTVLVCDYPEGLPIVRIEYNGCFDFDTTCTGVLPGKDPNSKGIYTLVYEDGSTEDIDADYSWVNVYNKGSLLYYEEAKLKGCVCAGTTLKGFYALTPDNPLTDCCTNGTNHLTANYGVVQLFNLDPKCCATCRLLTTSLSFSRAVTDERA